METVRCELIPGVWLTALRSDKFKTGCLSINLLTQLNRETAALNAVLPFVLRRGTRYHPDMEGDDCRRARLALRHGHRAHSPQDRRDPMHRLLRKLSG